MKERFKQLPEPLQQQVIRRFAVAIVFVLLFFITLFGFWDVYLFLPCLLFAGFFMELQRAELEDVECISEGIKINLSH